MKAALIVLGLLAVLALISLLFAWLTVLIFSWFGVELALWQGWIINVVIGGLTGGSRARS